MGRNLRIMFVSEKKKPLAKLVNINRQTGEDGKSFAITDKMCTLGRHDKCAIRIQIPQVPAEQFQLTMDNTGKATLKNLNSEFPTKVNSHMLLKHGDRVSIIDRCYRYESCSAAYEDISKPDLRNPLGSITPNNDQKEEKQKKTKDISHEMVKETPKKKKDKSLRSEAITKTISVEHQENVSENFCQIKTSNKKKGRSTALLKKGMTVSVDKVSAEETEVKGSSVMETKTPTKPSKKKRKSMAVGQIKTDVSVENVLAKAIEIPQESSVIASETPSKKKNTSIAVDRKETVSGENVSAEATKLKESIVLETKTPTKKRKKIRKSMSVSQEKTIVAIENALAKPTEVVKDYSINHVEKTTLCETKV